MAFPRKHLNDGEVLVLDLRPHWIFLAPSLSALLAAIVIGLWIIVGTEDRVQTYWAIVVAVLVLGALVWFGVRYVKWATTEFAVTNFRVMTMTGIFSKSGMQIPLERINTVEYDTSLIERLVGAGDLIIESASNDGRQTFEDIRHPAQVQREINQQIHQYTDRGSRDTVSTAPATSPSSVADELAKLDELRRNGVLSEAEFQAQKARLLQP